MNENQFEKELIQYITTGTITKSNGTDMAQLLDGGSMALRESTKEYIVKTKLWKYEPHIKTTEDLWQNFKSIVESHNQNVLTKPLSEVEFNQVKKVISQIPSPYAAGQFLYGLGGVSQIEIDLDDGKHVFLRIFDQSQIGAGDTVYQVVNQIERPPVLAGRQRRRFDTTLLINGLPMIQIEEKTTGHDVNEALNQMEQYIKEKQYSDIFSTLQILVAITPHDIKYMANTTADNFNKDFAFRWQRRHDNSVIRNWREFADSMLSIPMAHQMATNYMILDGTKNKQMLKVMRPYQVYATQRVIEGLRKVDFSMHTNRVGYVWHTTGSGKTITSFKTAYLASRMPKIDKVIFVVDRIALTRQTNESYSAYDPDGGKGSLKLVQDTYSTRDLKEKLAAKGNSIIVTSVQKLMNLLEQNKEYTAPKKNFVFIVDEAHRSTGGEAFKAIQKAFAHAAWIGYTGTPMFDDTTTGLRTEDIFGPLLHAYTIREAIVDHNVLGFKVDFETTIDDEEMKTKYLPEFFSRQHPNWSTEAIENKIASLTPDDMDDAVTPSFYDNNKAHVDEVVKDIFANWRNRSNDGKYNAILTTHVGGGKASTPMAMMYFHAFQEMNARQRQEGKLTLKVAVTFSQNTSNSSTMTQSNIELHEAIQAYNTEFGTQFGMDDVSGYTQDVTSRLKKTCDDKRYLDIVIVVDQLLTGFDAPELNTLYVDRTLKGASLIQAYSRTNRIADMQQKPWGRIINYRWPSHNEKLVNEALSIYANKDSAQLSNTTGQMVSLITAPPFQEVFDHVAGVVSKLNDITNTFKELPPSETEQKDMLTLLRQYSEGMAMLKQYTQEEGSEVIDGFDYDNPEILISALGMTLEQEGILTNSLANELKEKLAAEQNIPVYQIELRMTHVKDVQIDYDYLTELITQLLNEMHEGDLEKAKKTQEKIKQFAKALPDRGYARQIDDTATAIVDGDYPTAQDDFQYPIKLESSDAIIQAASNVSVDKKLLEFRLTWGITDIITSAAMRELFARHRYGAQDLDDAGQIRDIMAQASSQYAIFARDKKVQNLSKIKYRNSLRQALYEMADELVENYGNM